MTESIAFTIDSLAAYGVLHKHWAIAFSGGKDSTALVTLVMWLIDAGKVPRPETLTVLYADTRLELLPLWLSAQTILDELRARERGWRYAVEQLVAAGAATPGADLDTWLPTALAQTTRKVRHPGNFKYAIPLTRGARKALPVSRPYPTFGGFHVPVE